MKCGLGVFPEVLCCSPSAGTELRLSLLSEPPLHCRDFSWGRFLGFCLALAEVERRTEALGVHNVLGKDIHCWSSQGVGESRHGLEHWRSTLGS